MPAPTIAISYVTWSLAAEINAGEVVVPRRRLERSA
jgi:hypothetical protein